MHMRLCIPVGRAGEWNRKHGVAAGALGGGGEVEAARRTVCVLADACGSRNWTNVPNLWALMLTRLFLEPKDIMAPHK